MLRLYCIGLSILVIAILANVLISKTTILSWYDVFYLLADQGSGAFKHFKILDYVWLFIIYPLVLGLGYKLGTYLYKLLFS